MNGFLGLIFVMNGRDVVNVGKALCNTASTPKERKIAAAFRRVYYGTIALCVILIAALAAVMILNKPFLDSGTKRYGTVQSGGKISYVQGEAKLVSSERLGLSDYELKSGDRVIIFFDGNDNIKSAYPRDFYDKYTESRVLIIVFAALLEITVLMLYAFVICRLTPFGRAWYLLCRELRNYGKPDMSKGRKVLIYAAAGIITLALLYPQITVLVDEMREMREIEEFGNKIKSARLSAEKAQEISDKLNSLNENLSDNSGLDNAKSAAEKISSIKENLQSR